ncbi:MAG: LuxR family transcriptional regulator [Actinomycetota bacterium]|nr:LuxR family transcriptional regulator [Actinomycetota bacterium]
MSAGVLLEREAELSRIDAALAAAREGRGRALLVEGPAGIGKTALLEAARRRAEDGGMLVLAGRGTELERGYALGVVRQCLVPVVQAEGRSGRERLLEGAAALAAPVVLDGAGADEPTAPFGMLHGLYWLVANVTAQRAALLAIDDAQWADEPSLRFLAFLVRRVESLPVAVLVASRVEADGGDQSPLWQARTDPAMEVLEPRPLGQEGVAGFLAAGTPDVEEAFVRACHRATGGNPFLLGQLVAALRTERVPFTAAAAERVCEITPAEIARRVRMLLARLDPAAAALARAVAILGDQATLAEAAALAGIEADAARAAASALAGAGLLEDELSPRFRHPLLRGAVTASMSATQREAAHRRAADLLAELGEKPERRALHLLAVEPTRSTEAVATLRAAACRARDRGAPEPAAALLTRALAEPPPAGQRHDVLLELADAEHAAGRTEAACDHVADAYELAPDAAARTSALMLWGTVLGPDLPAMATLAPLVERALVEVRDEDPELALQLRAQALFAMLPDPDPDTDRLAAVASEVARLQGQTVGEARVLGIYVFRRTREGTAEEIGDLAERAARQAHALMAAGADTIEFSGVVLGLHWADRLDLAERLLLDAIALARRQGSAPAFAFASMNLSEVRRRRGMLREAEADARAGIAAAEGWSAKMPAGALAACLLDQGRVADAWGALVAGGMTGPIGPAPPLTELLMVRMRVRAAADEREAALADWSDALGRSVQGAPAASWIENHLSAAEVLRARGEAPTARRVVANALDAARHWGTPGAIGEALRGVARVDDDADTVELLREAVRLLERSPARLVRAQALVDLGAALRRRGDRRESRTPLREGLVLADACGAGGLVERTRHELAASGVQVSRHIPGGAGVLTASERRIADLAAAGAPNAEIAQSLFVTVKTVEFHLTHTYRKLGVTKRTELARALRRGRSTSVSADAEAQPQLEPVVRQSSG